MNIKLNTKNAGIDMGTLKSYADEIKAAHEQLHNKTGLGNDFVGWVDWPKAYDKEEFARIKKSAEKIRKDSEVLLVVGIGGSYLGARAAIDSLTHHFYNVASADQRKGPQIFYVGNNISGRYLKDLMEVVADKEISVNVISKSGTTTEPALAFRVVKELMEKKYGKEGAKGRIYATTDKDRGALKTLAVQEGYETFAINDDIGGRFSVLTPVGLLPIAAAGLDIEKLMEGALDGFNEYSNTNIEENPCYQYVAARNHLYRDGKMIEILVNYEPSLHYVSEWWKQLYGESEGKDQKGIFPAAVDFSTDLHSMGQYVQDGLRVLFETVLVVEDTKSEVVIKEDKDNLDNLNYLAGETFEYVNNQAFQGTLLAHVDGGAPNLVLSVPEMNEYYLGKLFYFFMKGCGISGYLLGVNPFNQPGVEDYKKNMFALLNKPGYSELREELLKRL